MACSLSLAAWKITLSPPQPPQPPKKGGKVWSAKQSRINKNKYGEGEISVFSSVQSVRTMQQIHVVIGFLKDIRLAPDWQGLLIF